MTGKFFPLVLGRVAKKKKKKRFSEFWGLGESFYTVLLPIPEGSLVLVVML